VALVRDALARLYDYAHLQRHPLTRLLGSLPGVASERAKTLRNLILDTLEQLNPGDTVLRNDREWRAYGILVRRYLDGFSIEGIGEELHISLRQFQREHRKGLLAAASMLWGRVQKQTAAKRALRSGESSVRPCLPSWSVGFSHLMVPGESSGYSPLRRRASVSAASAAMCDSRLLLPCRR